MRACRRFVLALVSIPFVALTASAAPLATLTWRTELAVDGNFCVYGFLDDRVLDVFGTPVNVGSAGDILCTGIVLPAGPQGHCSAIASPSLLDFDFAVAPMPPAPTGTPNPFVGELTSLTGSVVSGLGSFAYAMDGFHVKRTTGFASTTIPGCGISGPVEVFDGQGGWSAFERLATDTGSNVVVGTTVTYTNPATGFQLAAPIQVRYDDVSSAGDTTVTVTSSVAGSLSSNLAVSTGGYNAVYFDVSTTATVSGPIEICGTYADVDSDGIVDGTSIDETSLRLLHGEGSPLTFVDRTSSQDVASNVICASVTSLSPFVIGVDTTGQTSHDNVLQLPGPLKVTIARGKTQALKPVPLRVGNALAGEATGHLVALTVTNSTCPLWVLRDAQGDPVAPDFDKSTPAAESEIVLLGGKTATAKLPLTFRSADFSTPNSKSPARCRITVAARTRGESAPVDGHAENDEASLQIDVIDKNDY